MSDAYQPRILEGAITMEMHGFLSRMRAALPLAEDLENEEFTLGRVLLEMGIPSVAVERAFVNDSLVHMGYKLQVGDRVVLFPLTIDEGNM